MPLDTLSDFIFTCPAATGTIHIFRNSERLRGMSPRYQHYWEDLRLEGQPVWDQSLRLGKWSFVSSETKLPICFFCLDSAFFYQNLSKFYVFKPVTITAWFIIGIINEQQQQHKKRGEKGARRILLKKDGYIEIWHWVPIILQWGVGRRNGN